MAGEDKERRADVPVCAELLGRNLPFPIVFIAHIILPPF